ncbi:thiopeptide-type bacteriocin biosynthesis protein [Streptomyces sp. JJ66]|uniref:thiopeptide-type bacteriocin biosynthesis protein n=1 Tax=Streptomyces sp. JJ66 TaxID=2803843 RepID=UPI001C59B923|nr:thiopeptide-type bacteriocin biosynthesis protein [Streptomyces sp. JJ66]MBW1604625.1 thiopeptide-type bacteriocin biosynthesis protein [Streptomyces sp. JJ66]
MPQAAWPQRLLKFPAWGEAEATFIEHLLPVLTANDTELTYWSFLRKAPVWRLRYRPTGPAAAKRLDLVLDQLVAAHTLSSWTPGIYEPEETAFGGPSAMDTAHIHFHEDSRHVLEH